MKRSLLMLTLVLLAACDAPQSTRLVTANSSGSSNYSSGSTTTGGVNFTDTSSSGSTSGSTTGSTTAEAGFENCAYSITGSSGNLGSYGICQSTSDETIVKVKPSISDSSVRTCLVPTYKDSSGSSLYLSVTPQCFYPQASTAVKGKLYKDRSGYEGYVLNGLMILKEKSSSASSTTDVLQAYYACMNAYLTYTSVACPYGYKQSSACANLAATYRNNLCASFKTTYGSYYIDIRLK